MPLVPSDFDSSECLEEILELCKNVIVDLNRPKMSDLIEVAEDASELSDKIEILHEYLSEGGKLPSAWRKSGR